MVKLDRKFLLYFIFCLFPLSSHSNTQEPDDSGSLQLTSSTKLNSADYHDGKIDDKADRERTDIGIGEIVILTLTGKGIDHDSNIEWKLEGKGATLEASASGATLSAEKIMQDNTCSVTAIFDNRSSNKLTFNISKPDNLKGKKEANARIPAGSIGAGGIIRVKVHPTNVSFEKLSVIEKDEGSELDPNSQFYLIPGHTPNPDSRPIEPGNIFGDLAISTRLTPEKAPPPGMIKFHWLCGWYAHGLDTLIQQVKQEVEITHQHNPLDFPPFESDVSVSVSKFNISFKNSYRIMYFEHESKNRKSVKK